MRKAKPKQPVSVKIPFEKYERIRIIAKDEGREIQYLLGKAIDLFLIGYGNERMKP